MAGNPARTSLPPRASLPLGFSSVAALLCFLLLCVLLCAAPVFLSGFWPVTHEYSGQALLSGLSACACLMLALHPNASRRDAGSGRKATWRQSHSPIALCVGGFFAWCVLSALTSVYRHDTLLELARIGGPIAWFFIARVLLRDSVHGDNPGGFSVTTDNRIEAETERARLLRRAAILASIAFGIARVCWLAVANYRETKYPSQAGTFFNSNAFANYCAMSLPLALGFALETWRACSSPINAPPGFTVPSRDAGERIDDVENRLVKTRFTRIAVVVLAACFPTLVLLGLLVSGSKGGFLATLCALLVFAIAVLRARGAAFRALWRRHRVVLALGALVFIGGASGVASKTVVPRLRAMRAGDNNSTMFRAYTWTATRRMMRQRPVLGWGPGAFPSAHRRFAETGPTLSAHQLWLQIGAESGAPASLLLLGACGCGVWRGWRALRGAAWPSAAAAVAAIVAFSVHGLTDAGWSMTSVVLLLMIALALIDTHAPQAKQIAPAIPPHEYSGSESQPESNEMKAKPADVRKSNDRKSNVGKSKAAGANASGVDGREADDAGRRGTALHLGWLGATLVLALSCWVQQRAIQAEDFYGEAFRLAKSGDAALSLQRAREAVAADPLSARMQLLLAQALGANGQDAEPAYERATQLQPTSAAPWRGWARSRASIAAMPGAALQPGVQASGDAGMSTHAAGLSPLPLWNRALELDPNDPSTRLARGAWLLDRGEAGEKARGWRDLEHIERLADAPFGRYPAVPTNVDLNFPRAYARLARRALQSGDTKRARALVTRGLADVARARLYEATNRELRQYAADISAEPEPIAPIENDLRQLQSQII